MTVVTLEMALRSLEMTGVTLEIGSASFNEP